MGIKRRAMFNPKFKTSRSERWKLGRKMLGIPTEEELEAKRLEEEKVKLELEAEAETARLIAEEERVKLQAAKEVEAKFKVEQEALKTKRRTTKARKPRVRKTTQAAKND